MTGTKEVINCPSNCQTDCVPSSMHFVLVRFNENIIIDPGSVDIFPSSRMPKSLHHLLTPIYRSTPRMLKATLRPRDTMKEKGFQITTDPHTLSSVLQCVSDDEVGFILLFKKYRVLLFSDPGIVRTLHNFG